MRLGETAWNKGISPSNETREKLSKANMGQIAWNKGVSPSVETLARLSAALKGKIPWNKGIPMTEERKAGLSAALKGRIVSPEVRAKISATMAGRPGEAGRVPSTEARAKMSASHWKGGLQVNKAKVHAKRRALGFVPLNSFFAGSEAHHINQSDVIYIPKAMHKSVSHSQWTGRGMAEMNALAGAFLTEDWT